MDISVEKIASLAYLELSPEEKSKFQKQFAKVLTYVKNLDEVKMTPEEAQAVGSFHILTAFYRDLGLDPQFSTRRDDSSADQMAVATLNLSNSEGLKNAPASSGLPEAMMFEVPSIIER